VNRFFAILSDHLTWLPRFLRLFDSDAELFFSFSPESLLAFVQWITERHELEKPVSHVGKSPRATRFKAKGCTCILSVYVAAKSRNARGKSQLAHFVNDLAFHVSISRGRDRRDKGLLTV
jgi:hypothetical protein